MKSEYPKLKQMSERRRDSGQSDNAPEDEFDLLDVNHFHNVFDLHFDYLVARGASGQTPDKRVVLEYFRVVTDYRHQISHPIGEDMSYEDAFRCLDTIRRLLAAIQLTKPADEVKQIAKALRRHGSVLTEVLKEPLINNLPPPEAVVTDFVGREQELTQLWEWFEQPDRRRWALCGEGGSGKSAIAYQFAREVLDRAPKSLRCIFWLSAKKRQFADNATIAIRNPDFHNLETALDLLALEYGKEKLIDLPLAGKRSKILGLLSRAPALLIVDDIDSVEKDVDSEVIEFFLNDAATARSKTKVLFTSRSELFGMRAYRTRVRGLEGQDAREFIDSRIRQFGLLARGIKESTIKKIIEITGGSPLFLEDILRLIQFVSEAEAIRIWEKEKGDAARTYALRREFDMLTEDAQNLVIAACVQQTAISALEAKTILQLNDERFGDAVEKLQGLFLIEKPALVKGELRYEVNTNLRRLVLKTVEGTDQFRRIKKAYETHAEDLGGKGKGEVRSIVRQAGFIVRAGEFEKAEHLILMAIEAHGRHWVLVSELGWVYANWKPIRAADARKAFEECTALQKSSQDPYVRWCRLELEAKEFTKGCSVADVGLKLFPRSCDLHRLAGIAYGERGNEFRRQAKAESARSAWERSNQCYWTALDLPHPSHMSDRELDALLFRGLLQNYEHVDNVERILAVFQTWSDRHPADPTMAHELSRLNSMWSDSPSDRREALALLQSALGKAARAAG